MQQGLERLLDEEAQGLGDGTLIGVANYDGCADKSSCRAGDYGYCAEKSEWVCGVRLVLRAERRGLPARLHASARE